MPLTRSLNALVQRHVAADPAFAKQLIACLIEACEPAEDKAGATPGHLSGELKARHPEIP